MTLSENKDEICILVTWMSNHESHGKEIIHHQFYSLKTTQSVPVGLCSFTTHNFLLYVYMPSTPLLHNLSHVQNHWVYCPLIG